MAVVRVNEMVEVPEDVLRRALTKARHLYIEACMRDGQRPGHVWECWAEFEAVASYLPGEDEPIRVRRHQQLYDWELETHEREASGAQGEERRAPR